MLALDSDVCPTSATCPIAPLNTYSFLKTTDYGRPRSAPIGESAPSTKQNAKRGAHTKLYHWSADRDWNRMCR